jgi:hypothetical protein
MQRVGHVAIVFFHTILCAACGSGNTNRDAADGSSAADGAMPTRDASSDAPPRAPEGGPQDGSTGSEASAGHDAGLDVGLGDAGHDAALDDATDSVMCGTSTCFVGQSCVSGACAFTDCIGDSVPGDYATVQDAVTALAPVGGTICLGAQMYDESVGFGLAAPLSTTIVIQGVSPAQTVLQSLGIEADESSPSVVLKGLTLGSLFVNAYDGLISVTMSASKLEGIGGPLGGGLAITLDGVEITSSSTAGPVISLGVSDMGDSLSLTVENCYIHDTGGISLSTEYGYGMGLSFNATFLNNTFVDNTTAIDNAAEEEGSSGSVASSYFNNLFVNNGLALDLAMTGTTGNNALYGNTTNYAGMAVDGPGYVKANPMLDTSTPPGLESGSPCRGAGDAAQAPSHDYWGKSRGSIVDIGAVQSSP